MRYERLTTPQKNIWNLQKYYTDTAIANQCGAIIFNDKRNTGLLKKAIQTVIKKQTGLRLRFVEKEEAMQYVSESGESDIPVKVFATEAELDQFADSFAKAPIGLTNCAQYRFVVFELKKRSGVLVVLSHLISDAWTFGLLAKEVDYAYQTLGKGELEDFAEADYFNYVEAEKQYLSSEKFEKDAAYWSEKYAARPEKTSLKEISSISKSIEAKRIVKELPINLENKINKFCKEHSVTQAVLFETALITYLYHINPENHSITIGIPVLNRCNAKEKEIAGMFISTMPLTIAVEENISAVLLARKISAGHMSVFRHQKYPYELILKELRETQNFDGNLYEVMFSYQNAVTKTSAQTKWYSNGYSEVPFTMHIDNRDGKESHTMTIDYQTAVFGQAEEVELIVQRIWYILGQICDDPNEAIAEIDIAPQKEKGKILIEFNDTYVEYPKEKCVHEFFEQCARISPNRLALCAGSEQLTYCELDKKANALAKRLITLGVSKGGVIGAYLDRTAYTVISQLAVLKAGGVFLPIDHRYPKDRIDYMLKDCKVKLVLTDQELSKAWNVEYLNLKKYNFDDILTSKVKSKPEDECYVIYTSGSTGKPKGCVLKHSGIANFCENNNIVAYAESLDHQTVVSVNTISFDFFIAETLLPLSQGWTVVLASEEESNHKELFSRLVRENKVNIIETTPTRLEMYTKGETEDSYFKQIQLVVSSGEALSQPLFQRIRKISNAKVFNPLGPSECSVWNAGGNFKEDITIGKPIANTQIYILDKNNNPVPIGVAGELCIAGAGVGKGYLNRPDLTAEKFVPNPFATKENHHGKVMYHTGDLARWRADGEIEYLGRIDTQVKIRGLRIELGEIESLMSSYEGIQLAAVADKRDENNRQYLVGYYTTGEAVKIDERELRRHLAAKLPRYMVPNYFMCLDKLPMTASGKTDRKNLPIPDFSIEEREYVEPETETQKKLAQIWQQLLNMNRIGKQDDFFELGGDSLLAITMISEIANVFHAEISTKDIIENATLEQLAQQIENAGQVSVILATNKNKYVLLPQQKAIYAVYSRNPQTLAYNMPACISLPKALDREQLKSCIQEVLEAHRILKSSIRMINNELCGIYEDDIELEFEEYKAGEKAKFVRAFDLSKAPLVRVGFTEEELLFDMHHIVADGESLNIILKDIMLAYQGEAIQPETVQYADYTQFFYKQDMEKHLIFYRDALKCDFESIELPKTRTPQEGGMSKSYQIPYKYFEIAKKYGHKNNLTDTMVFLGVYGILLSKYSAKEEGLSSIVLRNRTHAETAKMVGMFVNTLPFCLRVSGNTSEYMQTVGRLMLELFEHQELPLAMITDALNIPDKSIINTSFVYQGDGEKTLTLAGQEFSPEFIDTNTAKFDLTMELTPNKNGIRVRMEYNCEKYDVDLMDRLIESYKQIILQLDKNTLEEIEVMTEEERRKVLEKFNDTYVEYPKEKCIHELFTEQAKRTPDSIALVFEDREFSYKELDEMSNSLAHFLREKGVKPNDIVPIIAKRSWHVIVAMLGILKAGGAYMPVDISYPEERINYMLTEIHSNIIIIFKYERKSEIEKIDLDTFDWNLNRKQVENLNLPDDLCYCLFTSGSTGKPKGTLIRHINLNNFANSNINNRYQYAVVNGCDRVLADTTFTFDISAFEIYLALLNGLTIILSSDSEDSEKLAKLVEEYNVDVIHTTPSKLQMLMQNSNFKKSLQKLKMLMVGAEVFSEKLRKELTKWSKATVYNGYGPTETTIGCCFKKIESLDITIGKPIANTQIYILDKNNNPVPIGVAGELCIAGAGVGKGYLNRPDLTAEKFVPNPFATKENHHGKVMYHTGDLARWRADGEIEYLGRIDTQVKIRGLRIELGEVESLMSSYEGIQLAAVADKRDENNRQYLVGYYTTGEAVKIDERDLRKHLADKLPKYMIPNYFVHLDKLPMTASGKTDRKNLPEPDLAARKEVCVEPETEQEIILCELLQEILGMEKVGVNYDFFEYGGDSLRAIEYVAQAHGRGIEIALQNVFDHPSVRELCDFLNRGTIQKVAYQTKDFEKYNKIFERNTIESEFIPVRQKLGNILLTGATGFLGAHVLDEILKTESGKVYCLVRSNGQDDRRGRLRDILQYYFGDKYEREFGKRIIPIVGDIEYENLAENMPLDVQTVIHTAASVKHYGSYAYFHKVNVEGTRHVVDYAKQVGARMIHISTLSVSGNSMADDFTVYRSREEKHFYETSLYIGQPLDNVYIHSKFEAERQVYDAMLEGLDAMVIRVGNLTNRATDYKFQPNYKENAFLMRVKALLEFGLFPDYLLPLYAEFSPIDKTAEGIVRIAQYARRQTVFHLNSNKVLHFNNFLEIVHKLGIQMRIVDGITFNNELQKTIQGKGTEYIFEAFQNDMDEDGRLIYDSNIHIENSFTLWFLEQIGFKWNETDFKYLSGYVEYFRSLGYLEV